MAKYVEQERRIAAAYRVALDALHLAFARETLDDCAASHTMRALRLEKFLAPPAPHSPSKPDDDGASGKKDAPSDATTATPHTFVQKVADALGPHTAIAHLLSLETELLHAYEHVDLASLEPNMRHFVEVELYDEQVRTHRQTRAVKEAYP